MFEIFSNVLGEQHVAGVPAIHNTLGNVNPGAGDIRAVIHVTNLVDGAAVNTHSDGEGGMVPYCCAKFEGALHWTFGVISENQCHAVTRRKPDQMVCGLGSSKLIGRLDSVAKLT
jgi:hypothetical protein